jgi:hypothetical protein
MMSEEQPAAVAPGGQENHEDLRWSVRSPLHAASVYTLSYLLLAIFGSTVVHALPGAPGWLVALLVTAFGTAVLVLSLLLVVSVCRLKMSAAQELAGVVAATVVFALVRPAVFSYLGKAVGAPELGNHLAAMLSFASGQTILGNTILIVWAALLGRLVSRIIREGKLLLPIAAVASLADIFTVFWGVVAKVTETAPEVVETFSATAPVAPPPGVAAPILTAVGIGDFLFFALFLALTIRYAMSPVRTLWATVVLMLVAPVAFFIWPSAPGMPGLPFLAVAALWANWRYLNFDREEKRALMTAAIITLVIAVIIWLVFHR